MLDPANVEVLARELTTVLQDAELVAVTVPVPIGPAMILVVGPAAIFGTCLLLRYSRTSAHA